MDRSNHYEAAFEAYLQWHRLPYVAVDETRRAMLGDLRVKSLDFLVCPPGGGQLLIDVKGRRFPTFSRGKPRRVWENWSTRDDLDGLERWTALFAPQSLALLVFVYQLGETVELPPDVEDLWTWRGKRYLLRAIAAGDYRQHMRVRSPRWGTVCLPGATFRELVRPFDHFVHPVTAEECPF